MQFKSILVIFICALLVIESGCSSGGAEPKRAFYYWQSYKLSDFEEHIYKEAKADKLYLKLFEVTMDELAGPIPMDKVYGKFSESFLKDTEVVPCVFIDNDVIAHSSETELNDLAENVVFLVEKYMTEKIHESKGKSVPYLEIQIDCDWMKSSKDKYFSFLKKLKSLTDKKLSCTLRLYPYKFRKDMGVPPVDRVMLLCYNLLNPTTNPTKNTILDMEELNKYLKGAGEYPLPIDIGLGIYSSCYKFVNGQFDEVEHEVPLELENACISNEDYWYTVKRDTSIDYNYYRKGQRLKIERVSQDLLIEASACIKEYVPLDNDATIAIYHLDQDELKNYSHESLDSIFSVFH